MAEKRSIRELEKQIEELKKLSKKEGVDLGDAIDTLESEVRGMLERSNQISGDDDWEKVSIARHVKRPHTLDYLNFIMEDYYELSGDRIFGNDQAIITALAQFEGRTVMVIGHQKGRTAEENHIRNSGMPHPEGYRKAQRAMDLAERFGFPIFCLIDTPGAYPGIGAEERHIGGAIAESIYKLTQVKVPVIVVVIGEGGSGGALAIGVGDRVMMMENAIYSVISPEGCASILWRDRDKAPEAARAMKITAKHLLKLNVIDEIVPEPLGGAQRDAEAAAQNLKKALLDQLTEIGSIHPDELLELRYERLQALGIFEELGEVVETTEIVEGS
jgi:acetyl-CoA carboxylase carboxyl transferase subunit alpha